MRLFFLCMLISVVQTNIACAYVGPGLGLGVIGSIFGVIVAVFLAFAGVIWYPLKRMLRKLKASGAEGSNSSE